MGRRTEPSKRLWRGKAGRSNCVLNKGLKGVLRFRRVVETQATALLFCEHIGEASIRDPGRPHTA
jgi:hypothetical protein